MSMTAPLNAQLTGEQEFDDYWKSAVSNPPWTPKEIARHAWKAARESALSAEAPVAWDGKERRRTLDQIVQQAYQRDPVPAAPQAVGERDLKEPNKKLIKRLQAMADGCLSPLSPKAITLREAIAALKSAASPAAGNQDTVAQGETPRTDKEKFTTCVSRVEVVDASFARQLERELSALRSPPSGGQKP